MGMSLFTKKRVDFCISRSKSFLTNSKLYNEKPSQSDHSKSSADQIARKPQPIWWFENPGEPNRLKPLPVSPFDNPSQSDHPEKHNQLESTASPIARKRLTIRSLNIPCQSDRSKNSAKQIARKPKPNRSLENPSQSYPSKTQAYQITRIQCYNFKF